VARWIAIALVSSGCQFTHGALPAMDASAPSDGDRAGSDTKLDARPFDPLTDCPGAYDVTLPPSPSRYRVITTVATFWVQDPICNSDAPGLTHAIVLDSMTEVTDLEAHLDATQVLERYFIGGVQSPTATTPVADWIAFDGSPLLQTAWHTPESEPDDLEPGNLVENQQQQLAIFDRRLTHLHDATGPGPYGIVCECDGVPVHPKATTYVDTDPNNPN